MIDRANVPMSGTSTHLDLSSAAHGGAASGSGDLPWPKLDEIAAGDQLVVIGDGHHCRRHGKIVTALRHQSNDRYATPPLYVACCRIEGDHPLVAGPDGCVAGYLKRADADRLGIVLEVSRTIDPPQNPRVEADADKAHSRKIAQALGIVNALVAAARADGLTIKIGSGKFYTKSGDLWLDVERRARVLP